MNKWLDSRVHKPSPKSYKLYTVIFLSHKTTIRSSGYCGYMPTENYTDGDWQKPMYENSNPASGEVLYWMEMPEHPSDVI